MLDTILTTGITSHTTHGVLHDIQFGTGRIGLIITLFFLFFALLQIVYTASVTFIRSSIKETARKTLEVFVFLFSSYALIFFTSRWTSVVANSLLKGVVSGFKSTGESHWILIGIFFVLFCLLLAVLAIIACTAFIGSCLTWAYITCNNSFPGALIIQNCKRVAFACGVQTAILGLIVCVGTAGILHFSFSAFGI